ncbi:hypothetical protein [Amycolatopsis rubida]|uniref:Uncharacterized protein n=1 Tax=Amycolatopsis rubida TaxID=112413 RepID=A0A1I5X924_9PSEU|nr:hypothetical protein [Amycolatopsis rubida]SFQ28336.1 hypothetical protein SAMN05421854_11099 [Amycolatopsis rubida]
MENVAGWIAGLGRGGDAGAGRLLHELICGGVPQSLAGLARATGQSEAKVLREANRLQDSGILTETRVGRSRMVAANAAHPLYGPIAEALYLALGTIPPEGGDSRPEVRVPPKEPSSNVGEDVFDGPGLATARARARLVSRRALPALRDLRCAVESAYKQWHSERDRETFHRIGDLGTLVAAAEHRLVSSAHHAQHVKGARRVGRNAWAAATREVRAEADRIEDLVTGWAVPSADARREIDRKQHELSDTQAALARLAADGHPPPPDLAEPLQRRILEARAAVLRIEETARPLSRLGTQPHEIGSAGERLLAEQLAAIAADLRAQADDMDAEAGLTERHPGQA